MLRRGFMYSNIAVMGSIFDPSVISGYYIDFDFSDPSTMYTDSAGTTPVASDGDVIGLIKNKALPGTRDASQGTTANKPLYKTNIINGKSVGRFDGSNDYLVTASVTRAQPVTIAAVVKVPNHKAASQMILYPGFNDPGMWRSSADKWNIFAGTTAVANSADTNFHVLVGIINGTSAAFYDNNSSQTLTPNDTGTTGYSHAIGVGANSIGGSPMDGDIVRVLVYTQALSSGDVSTLSNGLNSLYGVY